MKAMASMFAPEQTITKALTRCANIFEAELQRIWMLQEKDLTE